MADFFFKHKGNYPQFDKVEFKKFNWVGILAYVIGILVAKYIPGIPPINGVVGAFVGYMIGEYVFNVLGYHQENKTLSN